MEAFGIIGMTFGMMGMSFGLLSWVQVQGVSKELAEMKASLRESGLLGDDSHDNDKVG